MNATNPKLVTDEALMGRVRDGELSRLGVLFERHHARLYGFFRRLTNDPARSEDLVQDVFERLLKYRHTFRGDGTFAAWMYQTARNAFADDLRKRRRKPTASETLDTTPAGEALPLARMETAQQHELLQSALAALPPQHREVLVLSRFEHLKYREIGEQLGCSEGAVKVRVHRALKELRACYAELTQEPLL